MSRAEELIQAYATNTWLIGRLTEGITHDESLMQPPFLTNSTNWVLGHILNDTILVLNLSPGRTKASVILMICSKTSMIARSGWHPYWAVSQIMTSSATTKTKKEQEPYGFVFVDCIGMSPITLVNWRCCEVLSTRFESEEQHDDS
jgi:hypothetical protein